MDTLTLTKSIFFFVIAGLCEIGGGYLIWLWLREGKSPDRFDIIGGTIALVGVGVIMYWPRG